MLKTAQFWVLTTLALLTVAGAVANMVLFQGNRTTQIEVANRQQFIQQSLQLQGLYNEMIKALADLAVRNQDAELRNLLGAQGLSISVTPNAPAGATGAEAVKKGAK